jgi:histone H3/H4
MAESQKDILVNTSTCKKYLKESGLRSSRDAIVAFQKKLAVAAREIVTVAKNRANERGVKTIDEEDIVTQE